VTDRGRWGGPLALLALVGLGTAGYLLAVRLAGGSAFCGPSGGCDAVATSEYATILGIPVALYGVGFSALVLALSVVWWRRGDRRALYGVYGFGILGVVAVGYLTYLELFVIHAICIWCVAYAVVVVAGWLLAMATVRVTGG
jgi:uncharacterized membrane protein